MDAVEHGKQVLAAILHGRKDLLEVAQQVLTTEHFIDPQQRNIFLLLERCLDAYGLVLTRELISDMLRGQPPGTAMQYEEFFDALLTAHPSDEEFRVSIDQLRELTAERLTGEALAQSLEILNRGAVHERETWHGHDRAREWAQLKFAELDRTLHQESAPEGDMRLEADDLMAEYGKRRTQRESGQGLIQSGIPELDEYLGGGLQPGELDLVAAFLGTGKTSLCVQVGWHACTQQGKNVVFFTSETLRTQVRFKLIARHSVWVKDQRSYYQDKFPKGLNTRNLKNGTLGPHESDFFRSVVRHFTANPAHGRCYVAQVPKGATVSTLESRLARITRMFPADLVIIDYLALLRAERKRQSAREELSDIIKDAKVLAATYLDGRGVPILSPWQMSRTGYEAAKSRGGFYVSSDLADTNEAGATADVVAWLIEDGEEDVQVVNGRGEYGRNVPMKLGIAKNRDGERPKTTIDLQVDYATCTYAPRTEATPYSGPDALDPGSERAPV